MKTFCKKQTTFLIISVVFLVPFYISVYQFLLGKMLPVDGSAVHLSKFLLFLFSTFALFGLIEYVFLLLRSLFKVFVYFCWFKTIQYYVIYPFIFDGNIKFRPLRLLNSKETQRDVFLLNLLREIPEGFKEEKMQKRFKTGIRINEVSSIFSMTIIALFLYPNFGFFVIPLFIGNVILTIMQGYALYDYRLVGPKQVGTSLTLEEYFLTGNLSPSLGVKNYRHYLERYIETQETSHIEILLSVFENYMFLYLCEATSGEALGSDDVKTIYSKIVSPSLNDLYSIKGITRQLRNRQLLTLIGSIGRKYDKTDYIELYFQLSQQYVLDLHNNSKVPISDAISETFVSFDNFVRKDGHLTTTNPYLVPLFGALSYEMKIEKELIDYLLLS
ncbi:hypothetical protein AOC36_01205 [Erysipelothrix larvae]|uniref:Uncharacterized protein n=1 Tax=Erysipelothrix larvae TaxID=1514105 RepID=A0A120JTE7_9FIRM|nr:hypothetical protein [Erysipelothrix larvae]AMC92658.1 hypothetical protein AOC36_01205 [Erysipelothrix larvae]